MKKGILIISGAVILLLHFCSCKSGTSPDNSDISSDSALIANGEASFIQKCSGCHNFRQDGIGPQLGGLTTEVSVDWIQRFVRDSKKMIESGDERAQQLIKKYKTTMPSFAAFTDDDLNAIIAFINTRKKAGEQMTSVYGKALSNPIPDTIQRSGLVVGLQLLTQIPASSDSGKIPLTRITKLGFEPHSGSTFILDLRGKLYKLQNSKPVVYMDMAKLKPKFINEPGLATGFGSFAFHPDFAKNGLLYTTHSEAPGSGKADFSYFDSIPVTLQWVLTEWKMDQPGAATFSGKGREIFRVNMASVIHGVQEITFNPLAKPGDREYGILYIGIGDGGHVEEGYPFLVNSKDKVWGTIFRIDPSGSNSANGQYGIPKDNPFAKSQNKSLGEIYAYGFRNPHRITWTKSGQMLVCNIGQKNIESVNLIMPGHDYGWPAREGSFVIDPYEDLTKVYPLPANDSIYNVTYPVAQFDHDEGLAISGGFEYWGTTIPSLRGKFIFGDIASGRLFYIETADVKQGKQSTIKECSIIVNGIQTILTKLCGNDRVDLHLGRDAKGELYILTKPDGKVYSLVNANNP
jgi:glucose/arabinose dehydrogenase/mono/diheme cytochrome c family protein